jgi:NTE family protein
MGERVNLVLEGGGAKGFALVGAISELQSRGYEFDRVAGSSVGAIVGALVVAGYSGTELEEVVAGFNFETITGRRRRLGDRARALYALSTRGGIYSMNSLRAWLKETLEDKKGVQTFGDLSGAGDEDNPDMSHSRLVVTVTDITRGELAYLPWDYHRLYGLNPRTQSVADAVCASAAFPYYFYPQTITGNEKDVAAKRRVGDGVSTVIDGGVLSNFPLEIFDDGSDRLGTIGVKLLPRLPMPEGDNTVFPTPRLHWRPLRQAEQMIGTMIEGRDQARLDHLKGHYRVIVVETSEVSILDFNLTEKQKGTLIGHGKQAVRDFFDNERAEP